MSMGRPPGSLPTVANPKHTKRVIPGLAFGGPGLPVSLRTNTCKRKRVGPAKPTLDATGLGDLTDGNLCQHSSPPGSVTRSRHLPRALGFSRHSSDSRDTESPKVTQKRFRAGQYLWGRRLGTTRPNQ